MIVSVEHRFIFLSMPKCGSSAFFERLRDLGQITMYGRPPLKHAPYASLERHIFPLLEERLALGREDFRVVCLMREPIEWLHSWYRYRGRAKLRDPAHRNHDKYTGEMTFDEFAAGFLSPEPPAVADLGTQAEFVTAADGSVGPDALFRYENIGAAVAELERLTGRRLRLRRRKVSPQRELELSSGLRDALAAALERDYEIYESLDPGP